MATTFAVMMGIPSQWLNLKRNKNLKCIPHTSIHLQEQGVSTIAPMRVLPTAAPTPLHQFPRATRRMRAGVPRRASRCASLRESSCTQRKPRRAGPLGHFSWLMVTANSKCPAPRTATVPGTRSAARASVHGDTSA